MAKVIKGYKPTFSNTEPQQEMSLNHKKAKKLKAKKRVLKRVYFEGTSAQSSYSSLVSDYVEPSMENSLDLLSHIQEAEDVVEEEEEEEEAWVAPVAQVAWSPFPPNFNSGSERASGSHPRESYSSLPADEHYDSEANLQVERHSPRESFKVFNQ